MTPTEITGEVLFVFFLFVVLLTIAAVIGYFCYKFFYSV